MPLRQAEGPAAVPLAGMRVGGKNYLLWPRRRQQNSTNGNSISPCWCAAGPIVTCFRALARLGDCAGWLRSMRLLAMLAPGYTLFVCPVPQSALAVMELAAGSWVRSHASEGAGSGFPSESIAARQNPTKQLAIISWFAESHSQQIHANHIRQVRSVN
uniref:Uncharacterized protein n=1 Tax=Spironucleus salmonicida TaxID=348837 RepID=V6LWQ4_9EUKA|eukprot:EST48146.1 Hypothetical protein SS50377_11706 [Spironucleus salmonicida]